MLDAARRRPVLSLSLSVLFLLLILSAIGTRISEREFPPLGEFIKVNGQRLHYLRVGEGPPVLLLHGASANLRDMSSSLMPALGQRFTVVAFDRPGYGYSERRAGTWQSPADQAGLLLQAMEALGLPKPLIIGHSWAGSIVLAALLDQPQRVRGGVLLGGAVGHWVGSVDWSYELAGIPVLGKLFAYAMVYPVGKLVLESSVAKVLSPNPVPADYTQRIAAPLALRAQPFLDNAQDMKNLNAFLQVQSARYREIHTPLLAIHGADDEMVPWWNHGQRLEPQLQDFQIELLPGVGHAPHHAATAAVAQRINDFADDLEARP